MSQLYQGNVGSCGGLGRELLSLLGRMSGRVEGESGKKIFVFVINA